MKNSSDQKLKKPPISYYGGKQIMLKHILPLIPPHELYLEGCAGGAALFFAKEPSNIEVLNDINGEVVNFYKVLQSKLTELRKLVKQTLHCYQSYQDTLVIYKNPHLFSEVQRAWAFWVACNQSFASKLKSGWGYDKTDSNKTARVVCNKKDKILNEDFYLERLSRVSIENREVIHVMKSRDTINAFHYIDPPYPRSSQGHYQGFRMSDFLEIIDLVPALRGKVLISSYDYPELNSRVKEYKLYQKKFEKSVSVNRHSKRKVEVLTANYPI